jgi:hypothetical protein
LRLDEVAAAQAELPHEIWRHPRVTGYGEIAVCGTAKEARLAYGVEPAADIGVGNDGREWLLRLLVLLMLLMLTARFVSAAAATSLASSSSAKPELVSAAGLPWLTVGDRVTAVSRGIPHVDRLHRFAVRTVHFRRRWRGFGHRSRVHHPLAFFALAVRIVVRRWF